MPPLSAVEIYDFFQLLLSFSFNLSHQPHFQSQQEATFCEKALKKDLL